MDHSFNTRRSDRHSNCKQTQGLNQPPGQDSGRRESQLTLQQPLSMTTTTDVSRLRHRRSRMLQQMKHEDDQVQQQRRMLEQQSFYRKHYQPLGTALALLVLGMVGAIVHLRRQHRWLLPWFSTARPLPPRTIVTLLPRNIDIDKNLPSLVMGYGE